MKSIQYLTILFFTTFSLTAQVKTPVLSSYPSAKATIFLDFDGQYITGTPWNWSGPINAIHSGFSDTAISEIFNRVAEDYRPFDLNVTTDSTLYSNAPTNKRMRIIITPTSKWYGAAGGVSYVGSFNWGDNTPAWVFSALLGNKVKNVAEAISHEVGHTLGLQHQSTFDGNCNKTAEYAAGQGTGDISWAPIMGVGYYKNVTTWHKGPNTIGCNSIQNDIDVIIKNNGLALRPDDHNNDNLNATAITINNRSFIASGLINTSSDIDAFKIILTKEASFKLTAIPYNVGLGDAGANIDIKVMLLNSKMDTIGVYNPSTLLNAGIDTLLAPDNYYIMVDGISNIYHSDYGSIGYYSLNGAIVNTPSIGNFILKGIAENDEHKLIWNYETEDDIQPLTIETSKDGRSFIKLADVNANTKTFTLPMYNFEAAYYRIKGITTVKGKVYFSNTLLLKEVLPVKRLQISYKNDQVNIKSNGNFDYELYTNNGQLLNRGILKQGNNTLSINEAKGWLIIHYIDGGKHYAEKIIQQ